jgi:hypothetical protein
MSSQSLKCQRSLVPLPNIGFSINDVHYAWKRCKLSKGTINLTLGNLKLITYPSKSQVAYYSSASSKGSMGELEIFDKTLIDTHFLVGSLFLVLLSCPAVLGNAVSHEAKSRIPNRH